MKLKLPREIINITTKPILAAVSDCLSQKDLGEPPGDEKAFFHPLINSALRQNPIKLFCRQGLSMFGLFVVTL